MEWSRTHMHTHTSPVQHAFRCMAVVEMIMMERSADGVVKGRYALGWALLPLFQVGNMHAGLATDK